MFIAVIAGMSLTGGCNSSTGPEGGGLTFTFSPEGTAVALDMGGQREFRVIADGVGSFSVDWKLGSAVVSQTPTYVFQANQAGNFTLRAEISHSDGGSSRQWDITVTSTQPDLPPVVTDIALEDVPGEPGTVKATWTAVNATTYPIVEYVVAGDTSGSIDAGSWDGAGVKVTVPATTKISYSRVLTALDGVVPGHRIWVAVRARDDHGNLSPLGAGDSFPVSFPWYLTGTVMDDHGEPLGNAILKYQTSLELQSGFAGGDGSFLQGPFSSTDSVQVSARAVDPAIYTWRSRNLGSAAGDAPLDIVLMGKYGADATCNSNGGDFLTYLRGMSRTGTGSGSTILYKWRNYPVRIFIPEYQRNDGIDFTALCLDALQYWNTAVGADLLVRVGQESEADATVEFRAGMSLNGLVEMTDPDLELGGATPQSMLIMINGDMVGSGDVQTDLVVKGVCLHEFGHVLGLYDHSTCDGYALMEDGGGPGAFYSTVGGPISVDELNAVRCLRYLHDGVDMAGYDFESSSR